MRILTITSQDRRDFEAIYQCEHCLTESEGRGYDDAHFHNHVIPEMKCSKCGHYSPTNYRPLTTKYPEGHQV